MHEVDAVADPPERGHCPEGEGPPDASAVENLDDERDRHCGIREGDPREQVRVLEVDRRPEVQQPGERGRPEHPADRCSSEAADETVHAFGLDEQGEHSAEQDLAGASRRGVVGHARIDQTARGERRCGQYAERQAQPEQMATHHLVQAPGHEREHEVELLFDGERPVVLHR